MVIQHKEYKFLAERQQFDTEPIRAVRGLITDRNFNVLAYSKDDVSFYIDLRMARKKDTRDSVAVRFSRITGKPVEYYLSLMKAGKRNVCLEKKISGEKALLLKRLKMDCLFYEEDPTRIYPYADLAAHIIGYVDSRDTARDGIEKTYNEYLAGTPGSRFIFRDPMGNMVSYIEGSVIPPQEGSTVVLTIDKNAQMILEEELQRCIDETKSRYVSGVLIDPNTGEVLALANRSSYDLNNYANSTPEQRRNHAIADMYEPGSTFKAFTLAMLLDKNLCTEQDMVNGENGKYKYKSMVIRDAHPEGVMTVKDAFAKSSNIGFAKLAQRIDEETMFRYLRGFGFGGKTGISLPAEAKGILKKPDQWSGLTKISLSFGYEVLVSPLQLVSAYAALINGGILYEPHIVKQVVSKKGDVLVEFTPKDLRQIISEKTSARMRELLKEVVLNGTGKKAKAINVSVGGKTGTARMYIDSSYAENAYNASFIGFFPVEKPKYLCLILVNTPSTSSYYGGDVAAPVFKAVAERLTGLDDELQKEKLPETGSGMTANTEDVKVMKTFSGTLSNSLKSVESKITAGKMPDLHGMLLKDALSLLTKLNIRYKVSGSGRIHYQSIAPGTKVYQGMECIIKGAEVNL